MMKLKIPPAIVFLFFAGLMYVIDDFIRIKWLRFAAPLWFIIAMSVVAGLTGVIALIQFAAQSTSVDPHRPDKASALVTNGLYKFSRNPMYTALLLLLVAFGCYLGHILAFVAIPGFVMYMNRYQIYPEEELLEQKFGTDYVHYKNQVRRWL